MSGLKPRKFKDHRRYSFERTFGSTAQLIDINLDTGLANFNQNEPNLVTGDPALPNGCTALTRADIATNEDHIIYKPGFTEEKTSIIEGVPSGSEHTLEGSFKSGVVYGLQAVGESTDAQALAHRRGPYFEVDRTSGQDYFDAFWNALIVGGKCISVGTPWFPEMTTAYQGIVDSVNMRVIDDWHNWEICGVKTTDQPRMRVKAWTGGMYYFSRSTINTLMAVSGTDALTDVDGKATPADIQNVRLSIMEVLLSYLQRLLAITQKSVGNIFVKQ